MKQVNLFYSHCLVGIILFLAACAFAAAAKPAEIDALKASP
jgi:hypothetical protein